MRNQQARRVAVIGGIRIPFCRAHTSYARCSNQDMMTAVLRALVARYSLAGERLGDVSLGAVIKHSRDFNLARESTLSSGLAPETPAFDIQRACGTSLSATIIIGSKIANGLIDVGVAGGTDSISDVPLVYEEAYRTLVLESARGRSFGARVAPWLKLRPKHFKPVFPSVVEPRTKLSMGESMEITAPRNGACRAKTRTRSRSRATRTRRALTRKGSTTTWSSSSRGSNATTTFAPIPAWSSSRSSSPCSIGDRAAR
jgi:acetyl-CoA C-acetyltransferase